MESGDGVISMTIPPTCHNTWLTLYDFQCRMENGDGVISMTIPPICHTHNSPTMISNAEWRVEMVSSAWPFQHATIHNSQPIISNAGWREEMESSAWWEFTPTCHNVQLTAYDFQCRMKSGDGVVSMTIPATCHNAQLTAYHFKCKMESGDVLSAWPSHPHATMHNSQPIISNIGWRVEMGSSPWPFKQHATMHKLPSMIYNAGWRVEMNYQDHHSSNMPQCTTHLLWFSMKNGEWRWSH